MPISVIYLRARPKIICGHQSAVTTEAHYAEQDMKTAMKIMKEIG